MKQVKALLAIVIFFTATLNSVAQLKVGENPTSIDDGSMLEVESTTKAFVPPRMTSVQMNAIPTPLPGAIIYNTDLNCIHEYRNTVIGWFSYCSPGSYFHLRKSNNQTLATSSSIHKIDWDDVPVINTGGVYNFNATTNEITFGVKGIYQVQFQTSFTGTDANAQLLLGIINTASGEWIGRATHYSSRALGTGSTTGNVIVYMTVISLNANDTIHLGTAVSGSPNAKILGNESGSTGTGNVTNVTILKL